MNSKEGITAIIVAVIGLCSALGVALLYNWDHILPTPTPTIPTPRASEPASIGTQTMPDITNVTPSKSVSVKYKVTVRTRDYNWAGTDANVYLSIYGTIATPLQDQFLNTPGHNDFETGDVNYFYISSPQNLGDIDHIEIWHDNSGPSAGWYLDYVIITNQTTGAS